MNKQICHVNLNTNLTCHNLTERKGKVLGYEQNNHLLNSIENHVKQLLFKH